MNTNNPITFSPDPDVAGNLDKLRMLTGLDTGTLINALIFSTLEQVIQDGDTSLLKMFVSPQRFTDKTDAVALNRSLHRICY